MGRIIDNVRFNFLYIDSYVFGRNWVYPESVVPYNMFRYIVSGEGTFFIDDEKIIAGKDEIIYIPRGCRFSCYAKTDNFSFISIRFTTSVHFEGGDLLADYYGIPYVLRAKNEKQYFEQMLVWVKKEEVARMYFVRGYLEILIGTLISRIQINPTAAESSICTDDDYENIKKRIKKTRGGIDPRIQVVLDYVILHPSERYSPQKMAQMAGFSKQRFSHLFKEQVGKSPMAYIKELRLTTAARRLLVSNDNISDIGYEVGYEDPNYFTREFKGAFGTTPKKFRMLARE